MNGFEVFFDCGLRGVLWVRVYVCGVIDVVVYGLFLHPGWVGLCG